MIIILVIALLKTKKVIITSFLDYCHVFLWYVGDPIGDGLRCTMSVYALPDAIPHTADISKKTFHCLLFTITHYLLTVIYFTRSEGIVG